MADKKKEEDSMAAPKGMRRVLLQRTFFSKEGTFSRVPEGTLIPEHIKLPDTAKVWDGDKFVEQKKD